VKRSRGGLVFKAHRLANHSTLGWRVLKKKTALGAAQGQIDGFLSQLPNRCHLEEMASVGYWLMICPELDSKVKKDLAADLAHVLQPRLEAVRVAPHDLSGIWWLGATVD